MARRVTALILAGGAATRFGSDKAFASWQGRPFIEQVGKAVRGVSDAIFVLARAKADPRPYAEAVPGATVLPDRAPEAGPVAAVRDAMDLIRTPTVLVVPCDAPGLPAGLARRLVAMSEELGRPAVANPATGPLHDLFAIPRTLLAERVATAKRLEDLLAGAERVETDATGLNENAPTA